jgi:anion-transporting  ArsA/GET3 family ATPase
MQQDRKDDPKLNSTTTKSTRWDTKRIVFVSGKGGVGKSMIAAAIADQQARLGRRVLLAEIGDKSYYQDFWKLPNVTHDPIPLKYGFDLALWSGESCLREYVLFYLKMERLYRLFFENKVMRALVNVAPGLNEIAILGKITSGIRRVGPPMNYDLIVVDSYATGHALALFHSPKGLMEAIQFGPMGHHSRDMLKVIEDDKICAYEVVTLLEELPVVETIEFRAQLKREIGVTSGIIINKFLQIPVGDAELRALIEHGTSQGSTPLAVATAAPPGASGPNALADFSRFLLTLSERQKQYLKTLVESAALPLEELMKVPLVFSASPDELVEKVAEALRNH